MKKKQMKRNDLKKIDNLTIDTCTQYTVYRHLHREDILKLEKKNYVFGFEIHVCSKNFI